MTKIADLRSQTTDQLADELLKLKKEQFNLRFQAATGQMEKTHRVGEVRKDIAREALRLGAAKLPVRTKVVTRIDAGVAHVEEAA